MPSDDQSHFTDLRLLLHARLTIHGILKVLGFAKEIEVRLQKFRREQFQQLLVLNPNFHQFEEPTIADIYNLDHY
ncbi:hypothetical protein [Nostoc sp.]|uniref:hypothetical protein n=1 Tax=Nostoc sp. TaxID=1180 RepID=UPI002FF7E1D4